ncbi:argininosuccinate lyase [Culicoides brevitarsis]|uniref:argininosuccinate lyase n=1 Tax=Culicoides brevitarsis TaxID=469753 RepID=UPI00307C3270
MSNSTNVLWGGGFLEKPSQSLVKMNNSLDWDKALWLEDLQGSVVYAKALFHAGILSSDDLKLLLKGLDEVKSAWENGQIRILETDEDVHTVNERVLTEKIGATGGKLHTGRSRNDQVAVDTALWLKKAVAVAKDKTVLVIEAILENARKYFDDVILPGYTHLQKAQPIRFSHWILSYGFFLQADVIKYGHILEQIDLNMPLGSGAIAGNPFAVNRKWIANELGFSNVTPNSIYAVSDRDNISDFLYFMSLSAVHLSRLAEDLILYATKEFGYVTLSHAFSTGSSLMPNKRNPDSLELVRATAALLQGNLTSFLSLLKGLPSSYNKDLQYDKKLLFDSFNQLCLALDVTYGVVKTLKVNKERCHAALSFEMLATDVAYYLTRKGVPFRQAHHITSKVVTVAETLNISIDQVPLAELQKICPIFDASVKEIWNFEKSCEQYEAIGGTSKTSVKQQIQKLADFVQVNKRSNVALNLPK